MIETRNLIKTFVNGDIVTPVLKGVDFKAVQGEFVAIMGRSGAGKSTFMYQMSLLDDPTSGEILIDGKEVHGMTEAEKANFRLVKFGYVFQDYALLPELTALENVLIPLMMMEYEEGHTLEIARVALERVGLGAKLNSLPSQMSGGEQQRVSIARAIADKPAVLFADEPTANLDRESSDKVMDLFEELHEEGQTIIMVTHEEEYAQLADTLVRLDDGKIVSTEKRPKHHHHHKHPQD
ncbi:ABC transporter ATP-binding protein [Candidatus Kaiserbacteria bacterium]|nr:ABC transporter ATP-binding protein [Candidatus Kaiserbacteria bacterium]